MAGGERDFLGRGWSFPVRVDAATGRVRMSAFEEDIKEAIRVILQTRKGERALRPDFGTGVYEYAFREMDAGTLTLVEMEVRDALVRWEPRITDISVRCVPEDALEGRLSVHVAYTVRATNSPFNQVYPFYLSEGSAEA